MIQESDEKVIRKHLLGNLAEEELSRAEERLLADDDYFELLTVMEEELIDDYISGDLTDEDRKQFEAHFLSTPERRDKLRFAQTLNEYVSRPASNEEPDNVINPSIVPHQSWWKQSLSSPYFGLAAAAVIVVSIGIVIWLIISPGTGASRGMAALKEAYRDQRAGESRITEFNYAPPPPVTRGGEQEKFDYVARDRAQALIQLAAAEHPSAQSYHDLGRLYLTQHEFDKAIEQFEKALALDNKNAQIHSDLGAAYLERAISAGTDKLDISALDKSLEQLKRAIDLDNSLLPAYFNKALCLQRMSALVLAREAWEDYLKRDAASEWSKEAERNLQLLQTQGGSNKSPEEVFQDFMTAYRLKDKARAWNIQRQTKEMITGTMVPFQLAQRFIAADLSDQTETSREILEAFRFAGEIERDYSGDPFFAELAEFYSASRREAATLKQSQEALQRGYQLCMQGLYKDANQSFETAQNLFLQSGNHWESKVADYWRAYCGAQNGEMRGSSQRLLALAEDCRRLNYHWLEAQSYCWLAINSSLLGEYSQQVDWNRKAYSTAVTIGDLYITQKAASQLGEIYKVLGRLQEAFEFNRLSLPSASDYFVSQRQFLRSLFLATDTLLALRLFETAEAYEQEALHLALNQSQDPVLIHNAYYRLSQLYTERQNYLAAAQALDLSLKAINGIENDSATRKLFGLSFLQKANLKRQMGDYSSALEFYQQAAQKFDSYQHGVYNYSTHKGRLLCYLLNKDDVAVEKELPTVLSLFDQNRQEIKEEQNRNYFFDTEQAVYDLAIDYEYERSNLEQSYNYAEFSKARSLLDAMLGGATSSEDPATPDVVIPSTSQPLDYSQLKRRLPANMQLVEYGVLQNHLLIWIITGTQFELVEKPVSAAALEAATNEYLRVLTLNDNDSVIRERQLAAQLHEWLFAPLEPHLDKAVEVAIVPDKFLCRIPFVALLSRENRRVVDDYILLYAPSATVLVLCSDLASTKTQNKGAERLLSIGNPVYNRRQYPGLRDLPAAASEAKQVAAFYRAKAIFTTNDALKDRIEPEMRQADVIHFAAHYLPDRFSPARSKLLLTANGAGNTDAASDDLSLHEIQTMRSLKARVAILSACQSGVERYYAGEGLIGLSRAFLAAGIPLVVASQWAVETDSTAKLMVDFHRMRKTQDMTTTQALRQAQRDMFHGEDERYCRPLYWAAFFALGGHALY